MPRMIHWNNYANFFLEDFEESEHKDLLDHVANRDIAAVINFHIGDNYKSWLSSSIDALHGRAPNEYLATEEGIEQLKEMLMKIH